MNDSLKKLNEIMNKYFNKKQELESLFGPNDFEKRRIEIQLGKIKDNKEKEISDYLASYPIDSVYKSKIRRELEAEYDKKKQELIDSLSGLNNEPDYESLYEKLRELAKTKLEVQDELNEEKQALESAKENQYQELNVWNGYYDVYQNSSLVYATTTNMFTSTIEGINSKISELEKTIEEYDKNLSLLKLTKEENEVLNLYYEEWMRRIKSKKEPKKEAKVAKSNDDVIQTNDDVKLPNYLISDDIVDLNSDVDLLKFIYNDIISEVENLRSIKLNPSKSVLSDSEYYISTKEGLDKDYKMSKKSLSLSKEEPFQLPNGEYINKKDFVDALDRYYEKNKGLTYRVSGKKYAIEESNLDNFKRELKYRSALKLVRDNKISPNAVIRVTGKREFEELFRESNLATLPSKSTMPDGEYISKRELLKTLNELFSSKKKCIVKKH